MLYPDLESRRQLVREHQALLAQEARALPKGEQVAPQPTRRRRRALRRRLRPAPRVIGETDPRRIAERLGLPADAVARVQARGYLRSLDLGDDELRLHLLRGHAAWAAVRSQQEVTARRRNAGVSAAGT